MMNRLDMKKGGIDSILAYIVVSIPLIYILVFMIGTLYHYAVQGYISQIVKETLTNASSYGGLTGQMINNADSRLRNITGSKIDYDIIRKRYELAGDEYKDKPYSFDSDSLIDFDPKEFYKGDIIVMQIESKSPSLLGTISNFGLFGDASSSTMKYTAYREDVIRNEGVDGEDNW